MRCFQRWSLEEEASADARAVRQGGLHCRSRARTSHPVMTSDALAVNPVLLDTAPISLSSIAHAELPDMYPADGQDSSSPNLAGKWHLV